MNNNTDLLDDQSLVLQESKDDATKVNPVKHFNEKSIFYKGLFGMIFCLIPAAILGLILVKISLDQSKGAKTMFKDYPENYSESSKRKIINGRTMAYIGLALFILEIVALMVYMSIN